MELTGNLCEIRGELKYEWNIKDFLLLKDKLCEGYKSPPFSFCGASWEIWIFPYGEKWNESVGWICLFLSPTSLPKPTTMKISFSFKTLEKKNDSERTFTYSFKKERSGNGLPRFMLRSDLIKRKSDFLPSDALTVICTLKISEPTIATEFLDASAQTEEGAGIWKLQQHLHEISVSGDASDVILKVKGQEFKSHWCILAARSPVFSAMVKNKMKENITGIVDIEYVDPSTFSDFLNYLYTGSTEHVTSENALKLYTAADKYQVEVLKESCVDHMLGSVSVENFCDIFMISVQHDEEKLRETCIQYFGKNLLDIIETCKWQLFLSENPIVGNELFIKFVKLNKINVDDIASDNSL